MNHRQEKQSVGGDGWSALPGGSEGFVIVDATTGHVESGGDPGRSGAALTWRYDDESDVVQVRRRNEDGWRLTATFELVGDSVRLTGFALDGRASDEDFGADVLRRFGLRDVHRQLEDEFRAMAGGWLPLPETWESAALRVRRPGRRGMSDMELAQWAARYVEAVDSHPGRPIAHMAEQYGWSSGALRATLARARRRGFLTEARHGIAGGDLTNEGRAALGGRTDHGQR